MRSRAHTPDRFVAADRFGSILAPVCVLKASLSMVAARNRYRSLIIVSRSISIHRFSLLCCDDTDTPASVDAPFEAGCAGSAITLTMRQYAPENRG